MRAAALSRRPPTNPHTACTLPILPLPRASAAAPSPPALAAPPRPPLRAACPIRTTVSFVAGFVNNADTPFNVTSISGRATFPHDGRDAFVMPKKRVFASIEPFTELSLEYPWSAPTMPTDYRTLRITTEVNFHAGDKLYRATIYNDTITFAPHEKTTADKLSTYFLQALQLFILAIFGAFLPTACSTRKEPASWWALFAIPAGSTVDRAAEAPAASKVREESGDGFESIKAVPKSPKKVRAD